MPRGLGGLAATPFRVLVSHFFGRFFDNESLSPQADPVANLGPLLGLLATPGAFLVLLVLPLAPPPWGQVTFRCYIIAISMVVMAFLVVLKWDALFPDRRDYLILTPLPLRPSTVFLAKMAALAGFLGLFLIDLNFLGALMWPGVDRGRDVLRIFAAYGAGIFGAGLFGALAAAAIQGALITLLSAAAFRRISPWIQTLLMAALIMALCITPLLAEYVQVYVRQDSAVLYWFPVFWFAGLYEQFRPVTGSRALMNLGNVAVQALGWAALAFLITYIPGYRQHSRKVTEIANASPSGPGRLRVRVAMLLHRVFLRTPVERAVFHFIGQTITRSMKHRIFLAAYGGFGAAVAFISFSTGPGGRLRLPLTLSFVLVSGLRAAFNFPSELGANWAFQLTDNGTAGEYLAAMRKWILLCAVLPLFAILLPLEIVWFSWPDALFHSLYGLSLSVLLTEIMFVDFRKVAFTCPYFPGRINLVGLTVMYIMGFVYYSRTMAALEGWLTGEPVAAAAFICFACVAWFYLAQYRRRQLSENNVVDYEGGGDPVVRTLDLASR